MKNKRTISNLISNREQISKSVNQTLINLNNIKTKNKNIFDIIEEKWNIFSVDAYYSQ